MDDPESPSQSSSELENEINEYNNQYNRMQFLKLKNNYGQIKLQKNLYICPTLDLYVIIILLE